MKEKMRILEAPNSTIFCIVLLGLILSACGDAGTTKVSNSTANSTNNSTITTPSEETVEPNEPTKDLPTEPISERRAIADALRLPVERELKQKVVFKIDHLGVQNNWAFLKGVPQQPNGEAISYKGTSYQAAVDAGAFDDGIVALLHKREDKWQVVKYVIGATDVPYVEWDKEYQAPSAIFKEQ
ncbi:MAG TPA: hypothetical protein V6D29_23175 [Leptolyngbyaceae cyanobacterium]